MTAIRPSTMAVTILTVAAMILAGCQNGTDAGAPAPAPDNATTMATTKATTPAVEGIASLSAEKILQHTRTALRQAKSYHAEGKFYGKFATVANGLENPVDIEVVGKDYYESMRFDAFLVELLSVDGELYLRSEKDFFVSIKYEMPAHKWIRFDADEPNVAFGGVIHPFDIDRLFKFKSPLTKDTSEVNGEIPSITVQDATEARLYVTPTGKGYPSSVNPGPGPGTVLDFDGFGKAYPRVKAPPAAQVVDYNFLVGE